MGGLENGEILGIGLRCDSAKAGRAWRASELEFGSAILLWSAWHRRCRIYCRRQLLCLFSGL